MENNNNATQKPGSQETAKNLLLSLLLVALIIGSFWLSYHIGKRFLFTAKKMPEPKIEIAIPEPPEPPAVKPVKEIEQTDEAAKKAVEPQAPKVAKTTKVAEAPQKTVSKTTTASKPSGTQYYKVQAGFFTNKTNALNLIKKLTTQGFSTYLRKLSNGWRVQVGAFKTKTQALSLQRSLGTKGFNSTIIYE